MVTDDVSSGGEESEQPANREAIALEKVLLGEDDDEMWMLKPYPNERRRVDIGKVLASYIKQKYGKCVSLLQAGSLPKVIALKSGGTRVYWGDIEVEPSWYLEDSFLLHGHKLGDPSRMHLADIKAYWEHWYQLEQSGNPLTFRRVGRRNPDRETKDREAEPEEGEGPVEKGGVSGQSKLKAKGKGLADKAKVPKECKSDVERTSFLREMLPPHEKDYHWVITAVAPMEVVSYLVILVSRISLIHCIPL